MLKSLHIQNIALITDLEIEFGDGLNVLTGETGAGKSIIIGSFNFILGQRVSKEIIRHGAPSARVDAEFIVAGAERNIITEQSGIELLDAQVILSRVLKTDGKGECRINGTIVTADTLRTVAGLLINIHGQHETEVLLKPKNHVAILDGFGGQRLIGLCNNYAEEQEHLGELKKSLKAFGGDDAERKRLVDMYQFQIHDIETANLRDNEDIELAEKKSRMQNFEKLSKGLLDAINLFEGETGLESQMRAILGAINSVSHLDGRVEKFYETARSIKMETDDLIGDMQRYYDDLEFDPDEFARVDARLDEIKVLKRKYGSTVPEIFTFLNETRASLEQISRSDADIERIQKKITESTEIARGLADKLVHERMTVAREMETKIVAELHDLGMPSAKFRVDDITVDGATFLFSANAGIAPRPLVHIISGGEMSRFMLGLKSVTANMNGVKTMVFDEIDTGVSGIMGHKIAEKMQSICKYHQVICVTHLAQIAAVANRHFSIHKTEEGNRTLIYGTELRGADAKAELARMVGGAEFVQKIV